MPKIQNNNILNKFNLALVNVNTMLQGRVRLNPLSYFFSTGNSLQNSVTLETLQVFILLEEDAFQPAEYSSKSLCTKSLIENLDPYAKLSGWPCHYMVSHGQVSTRDFHINEDALTKG